MQPLQGSRSVSLLLFLRAGGAGIPSKSGSAEGATLCRGSRGVLLLLFLRAGGAGISSKSGSAEGAALCRGSRGVPLPLAPILPSAV